MPPQEVDPARSIGARPGSSEEPAIPRVHCSAILFDLDGVLVDSRRCIEYVWQAWALAHQRDPAPILAVAHGRRTSETLRDVAPELDIRAEVAWLDRMEETETRGLQQVPGARALLDALPRDRWAIVTSGSPPVARLRIEAAGIPQPPVLVTAADVRRGKPAPDPYLLAAARLGFPPPSCVVVEDAPAGVTAGKAAGMRVVAVDGTATRSALEAADHHLDALGGLRLESASADGLTLSIGGRRA